MGRVSHQRNNPATAGFFFAHRLAVRLAVMYALSMTKMTEAQTTLVNRAKANGGVYRLTNPMMRGAALNIPSDVAYVNGDFLVLKGN